MRIFLFIFCLFLAGCNLSIFSSKFKQDELRVLESNHTFSVSEIKLSLNENFSYTLFNGLDDEPFEFVLLKSGEDPLLVQHLLKQSNHLPKSYYIYISETIAPGVSKKITFKAPSEPGQYYYVALTDSPKESLFGILIVESPNQLKVGEKNNDDQLN